MRDRINTKRTREISEQRLVRTVYLGKNRVLAIQSLLRRVHHVAAGPDRAQAGLLVFVWDFEEFECGLFEAGEGGGCFDVGV